MLPMGHMQHHVIILMDCNSAAKFSNNRLILQKINAAAVIYYWHDSEWGDPRLEDFPKWLLAQPYHCFCRR